jgi:hypothetical protein
MTYEPFDVARAAFSSLELFRKHHASSQPYQEHQQQVVSILQDYAKNTRSNKPAEANFYDALALALQKLNGTA